MGVFKRGRHNAAEDRCSRERWPLPSTKALFLFIVGITVLSLSGWSVLWLRICFSLAAVLSVLCLGMFQTFPAATAPQERKLVRPTLHDLPLELLVLCMPDTSAAFLAAMARVCKYFKSLQCEAKSYTLTESDDLQTRLLTIRSLNKVAAHASSLSTLAFDAIATSCPQLNSLRLHAKSLVGLSSLARCTGLQDLLIERLPAAPAPWYYEYVSRPQRPSPLDIAAVAGLVTLRQLTLSAPIATLEPLKNLVQLVTLTLTESSESAPCELDLAPLQHCTALERFFCITPCVWESVRDFVRTPRPKLTALLLMDVSIDADALATSFPSLAALRLPLCHVANVAQLRRLRNLEVLCLWSTALVSNCPLESLTKLRTLAVEEVDLDLVLPRLTGLSALTELDVLHSNIGMALTQVNLLTNLKTLRLMRCNFSHFAASFSKLSLPSLTSLDLRNSVNVTDCRPLAQFPLVHLDLAATQARNFCELPSTLESLVAPKTELHPCFCPSEPSLFCLFLRSIFWWRQGVVAKKTSKVGPPHTH
eukprot:gnl/Hemi2/12319_TR4214_c1_g11_i2.p1 gnl/Hemi2/12319_TR4214_c1_g11~~gnl/Hemi2/12319_TR4214_c1_g11_i2.p1  ORF type:complete len:534 (-),score=-1.32 gnl/Hemi2/12319_TR4214_c1_g11_i2:65-1666(-)